MAAELSAAVQQLFSEPNFAFISTTMPDGSPQVTPVWVDTDGSHIIFNTASGRQKTRNLERDAKVAVAVMDRNNPYKYVQVRGHVSDITTEGANEHIDKMAKKYTGAERYGNHRPGEDRLIITIVPDKVQAMGL